MVKEKSPVGIESHLEHPEVALFLSNMCRKKKR